MHDLLTSVLDLVGLLAVAVGLGMAAGMLWLPLGPLVGGLALWGGSWAANNPQRLGAMLRRRGGDEA